ncbi:dihydroorotase [Brassicibacter mesophilus]|uniref:dihydroorotase n=1 Tax=Brassicibacter mesophilus TaxID=745119 RepID=UPI003D1F0764
MDLLIKGARIVDSTQDFTGDVLISNGHILKVDKNINIDCKTINGEGLMLLPSFIDMHCHFREPGYEYKEELLTGCRSALAGGYTAVNLMANTKPVCSNQEIVDYVLEKAKQIDLIDIHQTVSITTDFNGKDITHLDDISSSVKFISDDGKGVMDNEVMLEAMLKAKERNMIVISHAEDEKLTKYDTRLSENIITDRDIELAKYTGAWLHMAHVSTKEAIDSIIDAKKNFDNITCEVAPHHIALTSDTTYRVNPPLRENDDIEALITGIQKGFVDVIATDHAPHTFEDKQKGAPGISGLETAFSVCFTELVKAGHISMNRLSELMSKNPARIMRLNKGEIKEGYDADLVLIDINKKHKVEAKRFLSKGKNTPFDGMEYWGTVETTIKGGRILYNREEYENDNR